MVQTVQQDLQVRQAQQDLQVRQVLPLLLPDPPVLLEQLDLQAHQALPEQPDSKAAELT
jgi:hypothetical protein